MAFVIDGNVFSNFLATVINERTSKSRAPFFI